MLGKVEHLYTYAKAIQESHQNSEETENKKSVLTRAEARNKRKLVKKCGKC